MPSIYKNHWPLLQKLTEAEYFDFSDVALVEYLSKRFSFIDEETSAFLCFLFLALRHGHLCIKVSDEEILPNPFLINKQTNIGNLHDDIHRICSLIQAGAKSLPNNIVTPIDSQSSASPNKAIPVYRQGDFYYFQKYWNYENSIRQKIVELDGASCVLQPDLEKIVKKINENNQLLPLQKEAILKGCGNTFTIITGGPGTGKTYVAGELLNCYWTGLSEEQQSKCKIILAAPTGKAASNLERSLLRATKRLINFPALQAKTLHSLLGMRKKGSDAMESTLHATIIIVDECSMIDASLLSRLLRAIQPGTKLILLGDKDQLPPISTGMLFKDIIELFSSSGKCIQLQECLRTDSKLILEFAAAVKTGNLNEAVYRLRKNDSAIKFVEFDSEKKKQKLQKEITDHASDYFVSSYFDQKNQSENMLKALKTFCVLSPYRLGPFGTEQLNRLLFQKMMNGCDKQSGSIAIPIVIGSNSKRYDLSNGEVGLLIYHVEKESQGSAKTHLEVKKGDYVLFPNKEGEHRQLPALLLPKYELAYCLSVHKSQGSEYDHVMLIMPDGSELFGREMFYTAVTRARRCLEIWSSEEVLKQTLANHSERLSAIRELQTLRVSNGSLVKRI